MTPQRLILGLIVLTVAAFCLVTAAKLRSTPQYDRIQVGMTREEVMGILGQPGRLSMGRIGLPYCPCEEGHILVSFDETGRVSEKRVIHRPPMERLAMWLGR